MTYVYVTQCTRRKGNFPSGQCLQLTLVPKCRATQKQNMVQTDRWLWKCGRVRNHENNAKDNITISNLHLKPPLLWYDKKQKSSQSITKSKRHRPASKQWTTQAASHGFDISFFDLVSPKHGSTWSQGTVTREKTKSHERLGSFQWLDWWPRWDPTTVENGTWTSIKKSLHRVCLRWVDQVQRHSNLEAGWGSHTAWLDLSKAINNATVTIHQCM